MSDTTVFATVEDLEARWHSLTTVEKTQASALLADATDVIKAACPGWESLPPERLARVACQMVKRAMLSGEYAGVTQRSETDGPFTDSYTFSNPDGDLYLTKSEWQTLGLVGQRAFAVDMDGGVIPWK